VILNLTLAMIQGFKLGASTAALAESIRDGSSSAQRARLNRVHRPNPNPTPNLSPNSNRLNGGIANLIVPAAIKYLNARLDDQASGEALITLEIEDFSQACAAASWPTPAEK